MKAVTISRGMFAVFLFIHKKKLHIALDTIRGVVLTLILSLNVFRFKMLRFRNVFKCVNH